MTALDSEYPELFTALLNLDAFGPNAYLLLCSFSFFPPVLAVILTVSFLHEHCDESLMAEGVHHSL